METKFTKYQLPLFFLLSYLLSWWAILPVHGLLPHGVAIAAAIVIALTLGRTGLREWWGRLTNFRAGWLFLAGPAIVAGYILVAYVVNLLLGATVVNPPRFPSVMAVGELLLLGGMWEELGWSGYALPTLQKRFAKNPNGALIATLILWIFRGIWHLPLIFWARWPIPWYDAALYSSLAMQVIISWLYNKSGGSVPAVMLYHLMSNILFRVMSPVFAGPDATMYGILSYAFAILIALALAWSSKFKLGWRDTEKISLSATGVA
ncbi:MAG TPA: CPBP family intramembrane glutamic endopeptidase [Anaerolineales bacterium]